MLQFKSLAAEIPGEAGVILSEAENVAQTLFEVTSSLIFVQQQQDWFVVTETETGDEAGAMQLEAFLNDVISEAEAYADGRENGR